MINKNYRKELDGLRGISILSVVFYHFDILFFQGGFLGVDIFFVISGYLITSILIKTNFSFSNFYERRVRRLLPALFVLILIVGPIYYLVNNDHIGLKNYSLSAVSVIFFVSNFFFKSHSGYFEEQSQIKPLLHTWSLSIEEQFYFIFPIVLFLSIKFYKEYLLKFFLIFIVINILLVQLGGNLTTKFPFIERDFYLFRESVYFDFFSPLSRAWEFLIGSIASILLNKYKKKFKNSNVLFFGYFLVFASFFIINDLNPYPNIFTLLPVIGTFIIIIYEKEKSITYNFITNKYLVGIGLISYSLYLWHYPILIISEFINYNINESLINKLLLICFSVFISFISWKFIEKPFRNKKIINKKNLFIFLLSLIIINLFICVKIYNSESKKNYLNKYYNKLSFGNSLKKIHYDIKDELNERKEILKKFKDKKFKQSNNKKNILIIGDSHADNLALLFKYNNELNNHYNIEVFNIGIYQFSRKNIDDAKIKEKFLNSSVFQNADIIIISDRIYPYKTTTNLNWFYKGLLFLIKTTKENNKKLILTNSSPFFFGNYEPLSTIIFSKKIDEKNFNENKIDKFVYDLIPKKLFLLNVEIKKFSENYNIPLIDNFNFYCDNKNKSCEYQTESNELIFFDNNHITLAGAKYLSKKINLDLFR